MIRLLRCVLPGLAALCLGAQASEPRGILPGDLDASVQPCQDFYQYANGGWLRTHPIPGDHPAWGAFEALAQHNSEVLKGILEDAAQAQAPTGSLQQKAGDFYAAGMDTAAIQRLGLSPLKAELARIEGMRNGRDLAAALARGHLEGRGCGFGFQVGPDDQDSSTPIAQFSQGGLGLPDRAYYLGDEPKDRTLRSQYLDHVTRMFTLLGVPPALAKARAGIVLSLETRLAEASMTRVEARDPHAIYHRMTLGELRALAPGLDWNAYAQTLGLRVDGLDAILVRQPAFFKALSALARDTSLGQWKAYLTWHLLRAHADSLSAPFEEAHFAFYGTLLGGVKEAPPRWQRVTEAADLALGEILGRLYVDRTFGPEAKAQVLELVANLRSVLRDRIQRLDWMTPATRAAALRKLDGFTVKIGYPEVWREDADLVMTRRSYLENVARARVHEFRRDLAKLGHPVDRREWDMTPPTVNACYNPLLNEIVFPAGILQPPFFDPRADAALNYGAIGTVIGHEMTHAFDDEGRRYDEHGNLKDWWTPEDAKAYEARTDLVVRQFDALEVLPGLHVDGRLTLGENIADLGGIKLAFAALARATAGRPKAPAPGGFTPEQRFFLGFAQVWRYQAREETIRMDARVDPHAPPRFRVNAPLANLPEFQAAFGCGAGTAMSRPARVRPSIW